MYRDFLPFLEEWFKRFEIRGFKEPVDYGKSEDISFNEITSVFDEFCERMEQNYPFHSPFYAGQMLKPPHPVAWMAYSMAMSVNPNNHALDGGPPTSKMEKEVVRELASMFGYAKPSLGHLTTSGTIANLEALWVSGKIHPGKKILFADTAHYTHSRMCEVLGIEYESVKTDELDKISVEDLYTKLDDAGTLVVTMGTTGRGVVENLHIILPICKEAGIRIHVDAAYGGFFKLIEDDLTTKKAWKSIHNADSIVVDPHKHGLQPYGCGCVLFKDPKVGSFYKHDSPYTYFSSDELHLGEISLECSRAGAAAAALWFTLRVFKLDRHGKLSNGLRKCIQAAESFAQLIHKDEDFEVVNEPELDIVCYYVKSKKISDITKRSKKIFSAGINPNSEKAIYLSLYTLPVNKFPLIKETEIDADTVTVLRSVFMKPEHKEVIQSIFDKIKSINKEISNE